MATPPESFVDALNSAFGKQTTQRAAHAKGVVPLGKFVPSAEAASVSKALHFKHEVPVTVRSRAALGSGKTIVGAPAEKLGRPVVPATSGFRRVLDGPARGRPT
jgi:hypothetical protein